MKRRFVQDRATLRFIEVTADPLPDAARCDALLWGDRYYQGMRATDGTDIGTRAKQRAYMRERGLTTVDDFDGAYWREAERRRSDIRAGVDPTRKHAIVQAIAQLEKARR